MTPKFKAGDRIKSEVVEGVAFTEAVIRHVGDSYYFLDVMSGGKKLFEDLRTIPYIDKHYELVPTFPERWFNVYGGRGASTLYGHPSREEADRSAATEHRIGVLHIFPDGSVEMEKP